MLSRVEEKSIVTAFDVSIGRDVVVAAVASEMSMISGLEYIEFEDGVLFTGGEDASAESFAIWCSDRVIEVGAGCPSGCENEHIADACDGERARASAQRQRIA